MPNNNFDLISLAVASLSATIGGLARWWQNRLAHQTFSLQTFIVDMFLSICIGVMAFTMILDLGQPESFAAAGSALAGNYGSRIFEVLRSVLSRKVNNEDLK